MRTSGLALINPVSRIWKSDLVEIGRSRYFSEEEFLNLLAAWQPEGHRRVIRTAVFTGKRHGERLDFRRYLIGREKREIRLLPGFTKGRKARVIPMSDQLTAVLRKQGAGHGSEHVFCQRLPREGLWAPFITFRNYPRAAGTGTRLNDLRFHDLRHRSGS